MKLSRRLRSHNTHNTPHTGAVTPRGATPPLICIALQYFIYISKLPIWQSLNLSAAQPFKKILILHIFISPQKLSLPFLHQIIWQIERSTREAVYINSDTLLPPSSDNARPLLSSPAPDGLVFAMPRPPLSGCNV